MQQPNPLSFNLLGELKVVRGETRLELPPSRKTRALLAYLLLTGREHRRERLCELLWDAADDRRGALRWSLSKLRALIDDDVKRVCASRDRVHLDPAGAYVDLLALRAELPSLAAASNASTETLAKWAAAIRGEVLEGLDLPDFHDFQAWLVAEREQTRRLHVAILAGLSRRLQETPESALVHARAWARLEPLDINARTSLLRLSLDAGRQREAEGHYASALRTFEELDSRDRQKLVHAWQEMKREIHQAHSPVRAEPVQPQANVVDIRELRTRCIGREKELAELGAVLRQTANDNQAKVVLLAGEPGIGKTHLLTQLKNAAVERGTVVFWGAAFEGEMGRPYGPILDALRDYITTSAATAQSPVASILAKLVAADDRAESRDRLFSSIAELIVQPARQASPVLLVLDDVQWLDAASSELLHYLLRNQRSWPLMVALATRSEEIADNAGLGRLLRGLRRDRVLLETTLAPLPREAIEALVNDLDANVDAHLVVEQSGGNPLFALELARVGGKTGDALPGSVAEAVRERIERLGDAAADVLRWGAVLGSTITIERLETLMALDLEALITALEEVEHTHLLIRDPQHEAGGAYRFAHEIVRHVVYADLSEPRRRLMHRRVAASLRAREDLGEALVAVIAHHATLGHDHDLAASACAAAGLRCQRLYANSEAQSLARRGMHHASRLVGVERVKRTIELLEVQFLASRPGTETIDAESLRELGEQALVDGAAEHARLAFHLRSYLNWEGGAWDDAARDTLLAESVGRGGDEQQQINAMSETARCLILLERDMVHADALLAEAEARARPLGLQFCAMSDGQGMLAIHRGQLDEAASILDRARELARSEGNRLLEFYALEHRITVEIERGRYDAAWPLCDQLLAIGQRVREGSEVPFARTVAALVRYGRGEECEDELADGLEALRMADAKFRLAYSLTRAALIDLQHGKPDRALSRSAEARPIAELLERPSELLLSLVIQARAAAACDDRKTADEAQRAIAARSWKGAARLVRTQWESLLGPNGLRNSSNEETWP